MWQKHSTAVVRWQWFPTLSFAIVSVTSSTTITDHGNIDESRLYLHDDQSCVYVGNYKLDYKIMDQFVHFYHLYIAQAITEDTITL